MEEKRKVRVEYHFSESLKKKKKYLISFLCIYTLMATLNLYYAFDNYFFIDSAKLMGCGVTPFMLIPLIILIILKDTKPEKRYFYVEDNQDEK
tara:strand:- start:2310 stop:2588 length:279 start_codon:yes stop_codon:yes gene_type:complete